MEKKIINFHVYPSTLTNESRIEKEVQSLVRLGLVDEVIVIGINDGKLDKVTIVNERIKFIRLNTFFSQSNLGFFRYLLFFEYLIRVLLFIIHKKVSIINCHSLHVLPIGVISKYIKKIKLIYDAHELETEVSGSKGLLRFMAKKIEKICIKHVDYTIVVSDSIKNWYIQRYKIRNIITIRNIPINNNCNQEKSQILRKRFSIPDESFIFIYQGLLSETRGVNIILDAFRVLNNNKFHIVFLGFGPLESDIKSLSEKYENIHFLSKVKHSELKLFTSSADIGIHMILNSCLNHYYCLPNKIFEYFIFGLPVIVSDFPEMRSVVEQNDIGWLIDPSVNGLVEIISKITQSEISIKVQNINNSSKKYDWRFEEKGYIKAYSILN